MTKEHFIPIIDKDYNQIKFVPVSQVTLDDQLLTTRGSVKVKKILYSIRTGFYSPITLSGHLLVNNLSTSVYPDV